MLQIIFGNKKNPTFFVFLKSRREDYEISPQFRTQMGDGYDFFASVRDGVSIQHAFRLTNLVLVSVNSDKTGTITVGKHAHTCLKPTVRGNCTFKRIKESFEEWEIQSKFYIFNENEQEKSFFIKRLQFKNPNTIYLIV